MRYALTLLALLALVGGVWGTIIYVLVHFINKFW